MKARESDPRHSMATPQRSLHRDRLRQETFGRHEIIPIPFNQAQIATPTHPIRGQNYTYGYTVSRSDEDATDVESRRVQLATPDCNATSTLGCSFMDSPIRYP